MFKQPRFFSYSLINEFKEVEMNKVEVAIIPALSNRKLLYTKGLNPCIAIVLEGEIFSHHTDGHNHYVAMFHYTGMTPDEFDNDSPYRHIATNALQMILFKISVQLACPFSIDAIKLFRAIENETHEDNAPGTEIEAQLLTELVNDKRRLKRTVDKVSTMTRCSITVNDNLSYQDLVFSIDVETSIDVSAITNQDGGLQFNVTQPSPSFVNELRNNLG